MLDPQAQQEKHQADADSYLVLALQRQRNTAYDQLAQAEMTLSMYRDQLQQAHVQNQMLNEMNDKLIKTNAELEEEKVLMSQEYSVLATKLGQHAVLTQANSGVLDTLMTADNPPATIPVEAQAGEPSTARGSES